jgi:hypothetical protein
MEPAAEEKVTYAKYNRLRAPQFQIATRIVTGADGTRFVEKTALRKETMSHIASLAENRRKLDGISKKTVPVDILEVREGTVRFPFVEGKSLAGRMNDCLGSPEKLQKALQKGLDVIFDFRSESITEFRETTAFTQTFGKLTEEERTLLEGEKALTVSNIDTIFDNFVAGTDGTYYCLDYEWVFDFPIPVEFLKYRTLLYFYSKNQAYIARHQNGDFMESFGFSPEKLVIFARMEDRFQQYVHGENRKYIYTANYEKKVINIGKDLQNGESWFLSIMEDVDRLNRELGPDNRELVECHVKMHRKSLFWIKVKNNLRHPRAAAKKLKCRLGKRG